MCSVHYFGRMYLVVSTIDMLNIITAWSIEYYLGGGSFFSSVRVTALTVDTNVEHWQAQHKYTLKIGEDPCDLSEMCHDLEPIDAVVGPRRGRGTFTLVFPPKYAWFHL